MDTPNRQIPLSQQPNCKPKRATPLPGEIMIGNKIGGASAVCRARESGVPFYVAGRRVKVVSPHAGLLHR